jgi:hypothetical protein
MKIRRNGMAGTYSAFSMRQKGFVKQVQCGIRAAVCALRAIRRPIPLPHAVVGGVCSALAVIIKPHFVLAVLLTALVAAGCAKSWRRE